MNHAMFMFPRLTELAQSEVICGDVSASFLSQNESNSNCEHFN